MKRTPRLIALVAALVFTGLTNSNGIQPAMATGVASVSVAMTSDPHQGLDSNSPCTAGMDSAYVEFTVTNTTGATLSNATATLSGLVTGFSLSGGDTATRSIASLAANATVNEYWFLTYPCNKPPSSGIGDSDTLTVTVTSGGSSLGSGTGTVGTYSAISALAGGNLTSTTIHSATYQAVSLDVTYSFGSSSSSAEFDLQPAGNPAFNAGCFRLTSALILSSAVNAVPAGGTAIYYVASTSTTGSNNPVTIRYTFTPQCVGSSSTAYPFALQTSGNTNVKYSGNYGVTVAMPATIANTTTTVTSSLNPSVQGQSVTFNAAIARMPNSGTAGGTVTFVADAGTGNAVTMCSGASVGSNGTATCTYSALPAGTHTITATYSGDTDDAASSGTLTGGQVVSNPTVAVQMSSFTAREGAGVAGTVATLTDTEAGDPASDYTATIDWGDGSSPTSGTVMVNPSGGFTITDAGNHVYAAEGSYTVKVTVSDVDGGTVSSSTTLTVADGALSATGVNLSGTDTNPLTTPTVANFTDAKTGEAASNYTATIDWGDGSSSQAGTVAAGQSGGFTVTGPTHTYAEGGSYTVTTTVHDAGGASTTTTSTAAITDAALNASGANLSGTEASPATSPVVANFTDAKAGEPASNYTATINWGDGTSIATGTVAASQSGGFTVSGPTHTYAEEGRYTVTTTVNDLSGGVHTTATSTATIADAALTAIGVSPHVQAGTQYSGPVATFTDARTGEAASNYTATIDWGDGTPLDTGTISPVTNNPSGGYSVNGTHTYATAGDYTVTVTPKDAGGATATATTRANFGNTTAAYLAHTSATPARHGVMVRWTDLRGAVAGYRVERAGLGGVMHMLGSHLLHGNHVFDALGRAGDLYQVQAIGRTGRVLARAVFRAQ